MVITAAAASGTMLLSSASYALILIGISSRSAFASQLLGSNAKMMFGASEGGH